MIAFPGELIEAKTWRAWFPWLKQVHELVNSLYQSGTTAERPTSLLWIGRRYLDTTIGKPIWVLSVNPTVWITADGTTA